MIEYDALQCYQSYLQQTNQFNTNSLISSTSTSTSTYMNIQNEIAICRLESIFGLEYSDISGEISRIILSIDNKSSIKYLIHPSARASLSIQPQRKRLRLGIISSDFGVHPVSTLVRGLLQFINKTEIELFCFSITGEVSSVVLCYVMLCCFVLSCMFVSVYALVLSIIVCIYDFYSVLL